MTATNFPIPDRLFPPELRTPATRRAGSRADSLEQELQSSWKGRAIIYCDKLGLLFLVRIGAFFNQTIASLLKSYETFSTYKSDLEQKQVVLQKREQIARAIQALFGDLFEFDRIPEYESKITSDTLSSAPSTSMNYTLKEVQPIPANPFSHISFIRHPDIQIGGPVMHFKVAVAAGKTTHLLIYWQPTVGSIKNKEKPLKGSVSVKIDPYFFPGQPLSAWHTLLWQNDRVVDTGEFSQIVKQIQQKS